VYFDRSSVLSSAALRGDSFEEEEEEGDGSESEVVSGVSSPAVVEGKRVNEDEMRSETRKRFTS